MASVPDKAILNFHRLEPAEIEVFSFYCLCRNKDSGGWQLRDEYVAKKMRLSRSRVNEARRGLQKKGWIKCLSDHFILVIFGFKDVENSTKFVENSTDLVENSTTPLKEINQTDLPERFTSFSAESGKPNSADKNSAVSKNGLSPHRGGAKSNGNGLSPHGGGAKPDERRNHPAILMVKSIAGKYPHKDQWDKIIREIGDNPDTEFFNASWEIWRSFDGKPTNLQGWLFKPRKTGKLPEVFGASVQPDATVSPPMVERGETDFEDIEAEPLDDGRRQNALVILRGMLRSSNLEDLQAMAVNYTEEDWQWLMKELQAKSAKP